MGGTVNQVQFNDETGHWHDTLNNIDDTTPDPYDNGSGWAELALPLCGCGSPEVIVKAMVEYLLRVAASKASNFTTPQVRDRHDDKSEPMLSDLLLAYMADDVGLTEHGSSVYGTWLTPAGERWLEMANREHSWTN